MSERFLEECRLTLNTNDARTLERRSKRLQELGTTVAHFPSQREWDYSTEAGDCYVNGHYRSAIFCCACAVEQIFKIEYLKIPGNRYEDIGERTYGQAIQKCKQARIPSLAEYIPQAEMLNKIRNKVAVHPLFFEIPVKSDNDNNLRKELLCRDMIVLLDLVGEISPKYKREIASTSLEYDAEGKSYILGEAIKKPLTLPWSMNSFCILIENDILKFLASRSLKIEASIIEGV